MMLASDSSETTGVEISASPDAAVVSAAAVMKNWRRDGAQSRGNIGNSDRRFAGSEVILPRRSVHFLMPATAITLPVLPFSARYENNNSGWQFVHNGEV